MSISSTYYALNQADKNLEFKHRSSLCSCHNDLTWDFVRIDLFTLVVGAIFTTFNVTVIRIEELSNCFSMFRVRVRNIAHPGIRQFILRTAVLNYLGKCLQLQWDDWQNQRMHLRTLQHEGARTSESVAEDAVVDAARENLSQAIDELGKKVAGTHKLLQREYNELFTYMMDKRDLWDSPEYFKAKTALGTANHNLRMYMSVDK